MEIVLIPNELQPNMLSNVGNIYPNAETMEVSLMIVLRCEESEVGL